MAKLIVAISGWKGSGKDAAANHLMEKHGFKRLGFADPLKDSVAAEYGIARQYLDDQSKKEQPILSRPVYCKDSFSAHINTFLFREFVDINGKHPSAYEILSDGRMYGVTAGHPVPLYHCPRSLAILEGSSRRSVDPNFWVSKAVSKTEDGAAYVISDLRYLSEIEALQNSLTGEDRLVTVRVNRFKSTESKDPSERDLDNHQFSYTINNNGSLSDFLAAVDSMALGHLLRSGR